jgi:hypothetical protein
MADPVDPLVSTRFDEVSRSLGEGPQSRAEIERVLADLGRHLRLEGLGLNEDGVAQLRVDGEIDVLLAHYPHLPGLVVAIPVPEADADDPSHVKLLLQANMSWQLTQGGIFSTVPGTDQPALFSLLLTRDRGIAEIERDLAVAVSCAKQWKAALAGASRNEPGSAEQPGGMPNTGIIKV